MEGELYICSSIDEPIAAGDHWEAVPTLQHILNIKRIHGAKIRGEPVTAELGKRYTAITANGFEKYWLSIAPDGKLRFCPVNDASVLE
jgi:hypothetical protein